MLCRVATLPVPCAIRSYREQLELGTRPGELSVHDADGVTWVFDARRLDDPVPWRVVAPE